MVHTYDVKPRNSSQEIGYRLSNADHSKSRSRERSSACDCKRDFGRVGMVLAFILQQVFLYIYLVTYIRIEWLFLLPCDVIVLSVFVADAAYAHYVITNLGARMPVALIHIGKWYKGPRDARNVVWILYVVLLIIKISVLISGAAYRIPASATFGPHGLILTLSITPGIYLLLDWTNYAVKPHSKSAFYRSELRRTAVINIIDAIDLLLIFIFPPGVDSMAFPAKWKFYLGSNGTHISNTTSRSIQYFYQNVTGNITLPKDSSLLSFGDFNIHAERSLIAFASISLIIVGLYSFDVYLYALGERGLEYRELVTRKGYMLIYMVLINVPYIVLRMYFWVVFRYDMSALIGKNVMFMFHGILEVIKSTRNGSEPVVCAGRNGCWRVFPPGEFDFHVAPCKHGIKERIDLKLWPVWPKHIFKEMFDVKVDEEELFLGSRSNAKQRFNEEQTKHKPSIMYSMSRYSYNYSKCKVSTV